MKNLLKSYFLKPLLVVVWTILTSSLVLGQSETWLQHNSLLNFESKPNSSKFQKLIGANTSKELPESGFGFQSKGIITNARSFHLMEGDFGNNFLPKDIDLQQLDCSCDEIAAYFPANCRPELCTNGLTGPGNEILYGFHNWKSFYCQWRKNSGITRINASLEAIFPLFDSICVLYDAQFNCLQKVLKNTRNFPFSC